MKSLRPLQRHDITRLALAKVPRKEIADRVGVSLSCVHTVLHGELSLQQIHDLETRPTRFTVARIRRLADAPAEEL